MAKPKGRNRDLYEATHTALLVAAESLFAVEGYDAVKTEQVAAAAGVSNGTLFHHFRTKRALFIAVHNRRQADLIDRIEESASRAADAMERFTRIWKAYLSSTEDPAMRRILLLDGPRVIGLEALRAHDRETAFAYFQRELRALQSAGLLPPGPLRALAVLLFGALDQAAFEMADFPEDPALRSEILKEMERLVAALTTSTA